MQKITFFLAAFLFVQSVFAERAMYVDDFDTVINSSTAKTSLLSYAQNNGISYLILYDLHTVHNQHKLTNAATNQILANFIADAKQNYGITKIAAAGENAWFFQNRIIAYNATRSAANEKFDVLGMEFEFWTPVFIQPGGYYCTNYLTPNGLTCDSTGAFAFCIDQLQQMKTMATSSSHPMTVEMYVGWPNAGQLKTIANIVDKTLIHAYVTNPNTAFNYALTRLQLYDTYSGVENVSIIFSAEPSFMGPWLAANNMATAEQSLISAYTAASGAWKSHVNFDGFTYFTYSMMSNIVLPIELIDFQALVSHNDVQLQWEVGKQKDILGFEVEASLDGILFSSLGFVEIKEEQSYIFIDKNGLEKGTVYYRLKTLETNGDYTYSKIVFFKNTHAPQLEIYPNPATTQLFFGKKGTRVNSAFKIFNASGMLVFKGDQLPDSLNLEHFDSGTYRVLLGGFSYFFQKQ